MLSSAAHSHLTFPSMQSLHFPPLSWISKIAEIRDAMPAHFQAILLTSPIWGVYFSHENSCMNNHENLPFSAPFDPTTTGRAMWENHANGVHTCSPTSKFHIKTKCIYMVNEPNLNNWFLFLLSWEMSWLFHIWSEMQILKWENCSPLKANTRKLADFAKWMCINNYITVSQCRSGQVIECKHARSTCMFISCSYSWYSSLITWSQKTSASL